MFFWLKKFIAFWLTPMTVCVGLMAFGLWLMRSERRRGIGRRFLLGGLGLLLVCSNHFVARGLMRPLETRYPAIPELRAADAPPPRLAACRYVVVLGSGHGNSPGLPALGELSGSGLARIAEGVRLLRFVPDAKLIVSGPSDGRHEAHATVLARAAVSLGIDPRRIVLVDQARDTEDEARIVRTHTGDAPLALVTSAWHMSRAMALFRKQGMDPLACPTDYITHTEDSFAFTQLLWDARALECTTWVFYERIGYLWIRLRGKG